MPLSRGESLLLAYNRRDYGSGAAIIEAIDKTPTCCFDLWTRVEQLEQVLREIARTWPNAKRSGRRPSLSAEEAQRRADAALHPDRLQDTDVVPGALAQRFKDERNIARARVEQLEQALRKAWLGIAGLHGPTHNCDPEECWIGQCALVRAALHPDQPETT